MKAGKNEARTTTPGHKKGKASTNLVIPADALRWKLRKLQTLQRQIARGAETGPGNVNIKEYINLLNVIEEELNKLKNRDADKKNLDRQVRSARSGGVRQEKPAGVGAGVLPSDLITG